MTNSEIPLSVVRGDEDILGELFKSLAKTEATQVFVTGPDAFRTLADSVDSITAVLGQTWTVLPCQYAPTQADMRLLMEEFASAIDGAPSQRRICFGPTSPERLLEYLFRPSKNGFYKAGLYILGFCDPPIGNLVQFGKAVNTEGKAPGFLESIISAEDNGLLISEQQELRTLLEQGGDVRDKLWKIMASRQEQVEAEEKALREPLPPERPGFLARLFRRKSRADVLTTIAETERRKRGLLPPPQNIAFNYKCECGVYLSVDLKNFNVFGGVQVTCAHCGAVCFVPPEILDHTKYDPSRRGATLRGDYQSLLRFVRHRSRS
jgi:hypothetical protein